MGLNTLANRLCTLAYWTLAKRLVSKKTRGYYYYNFPLLFITVRTAVNYRPLPCSTGSLIGVITIPPIFPFCLEDTRSDQERKKTIIG